MAKTTKSRTSKSSVSPRTVRSKTRGGGFAFRTLAIHAGQPPDPSTGAITVPIYQTSTYVQAGVGDHKGFEYSRTGNPTRKALEDNIAALEGGHGGSAFGSGMAAISTLIQMFDEGSHFVVGQNVYGGTFRLFDKVHARAGYKFTWVDTRDLKAIERAFTRKTKLLFLETPTNPMMHITDLAAASALAHSRGIKVAVDNTFLTPYYQRPIEHGADFVIHSATKYLGGHSDCLGGLLVTRDPEDTQRVRFLQNAVGGILGPFDAWLILRGIKTLAVRMDAHEKNAHLVADFLAGHKKVAKVFYPGLPDHPGHDINARQSRGAGGLLSFEMVRGTDPRKFLKGTRVCALAESLGAVESLLCVPAMMTHASVPAADRKKLGITDTLLRIAVGIEDPDDLLVDLEAALARA